MIDVERRRGKESRPGSAGPNSNNFCQAFGEMGEEGVVGQGTNVPCGLVKVGQGQRRGLDTLPKRLRHCKQVENETAVR